MAHRVAAKRESSAETGGSDILPSAKDAMRRIAEIEAKKASDYVKKKKVEEAEKKALLDG